MSLPEYITAIRSIAYNTQEIRESLQYYDDAPVSDEDIMALIDEWAYEDLGGEYRLVTEDGDELKLVIQAILVTTMFLGMAWIAVQFM